MIYSIIHDEKQIVKFIENLADTDDGVYYLQLLVRKKFLPVGFLASNDDEYPIFRKFCKKNEILKNIKLMEVKLGGFIYNDKEIPDNSFGVYISSNPYSIKSAFIKSSAAILDLISNNEYYSTPDRVAMRASISPKVKTPRKYPLYDIRYITDMDYDTKDNNILELLIENANQFVGIGNYDIIESRGGYHVLIVNKKAISNQWYVNMEKLPGFDSKADYTPIPGTYLGGFKVTYR